jgi:hypothetical protein
LEGYSEYYSPYAPDNTNSRAEENKKMPRSYAHATFKPEISVFQTAYQDATSKSHFPGHYSHYGYLANDNIGFRKLNSGRNTAANKESSVSSEAPTQYQEMPSYPYANLVPEYRNMQSMEVLDKFELKQPYLAHSSLPDINASPMRLNESYFERTEHQESSHSNSPTRENIPALPTQYLKDIKAPQRANPTNRDISHSRGKHKATKRMAPKVHVGKPFKAVVTDFSRKAPIRVNKKNGEYGSVWKDLSRIASEIIDTGKRGLQALGSETSYQYVDVDKSNDMDVIEGLTGKESYD